MYRDAIVGTLFKIIDYVEFYQNNSCLLVAISDEAICVICWLKAGDLYIQFLLS